MRMNQERLRIPRPVWRFWLAATALVWLALGAAGWWGVARLTQGAAQITRFRAGGSGPEDSLDAITKGYRFNLAAWQAPEFARWAIDSLAIRPGDADEQGVRAVSRYFELGAAIRRGRLRQANATGPEAQAQAATALATLQQERDGLEVAARRALNQLVTTELGKRGLGTGPNGQVLPPVAFTLARPPSVLVISPRDRIFTERRTILAPDIPDATAEAMEREAEAQGWSAIVEPTGGYSTYPTIVSDSTSLDFALQTVAHEWMHTYLISRPLGFNYFSSPQMATINETVANLVGREVGRGVQSVHFPPRPAATPAPATTPEPATSPTEPAPERFDFRREMRATRQEAERLLQSGQVEAAETYMEERRRLFAQQGYAIRKLNQAYFAFHGSYADTPGSIDPIGPALEQVLQATGSVSAFVRAVEGIGSFADYQALLARYNVPETAPAPRRP
jgi:hypothetical protein